MISGKLCTLTLAAAAMLVSSTALARSHHNAVTVKAVPDAIAYVPDIKLAAPNLLPAEVAEVEVTPAGDPSVQRGSHISCVPYARQRSGLQIFGDARVWWDKARDLYSHLTSPVVKAVMVFSRSGRIARGHVAVVSKVVSPREIRIDHANWQNHGEVDLNMPVLDVSQNNDWSLVRVWNMSSRTFGTHVYKISGFIGQSPTH